MGVAHPRLLLRSAAEGHAVRRRRDWTVAAGVSSLALALALPAAAPARAGCRAANRTPDQVPAARLERAMVCLFNRQRALHGLAPLRFDGRLASAASAYAQTLVQDRFFAHGHGPGTSLDRRLRRAGYGCAWCEIGEDLAEMDDGATPREIVQAWMQSPDHRANILHRRFRAVGPGFARGTPDWGTDAGATYVADFASR
jgi:uncharacterized protein YkwD